MSAAAVKAKLKSMFAASAAVVQTAEARYVVLLRKAVGGTLTPAEQDQLTALAYERGINAERFDADVETLKSVAAAEALAALVPARRKDVQSANTDVADYKIQTAAFIRERAAEQARLIALASDAQRLLDEATAAEAGRLGMLKEHARLLGREFVPRCGYLLPDLTDLATEASQAEREAERMAKSPDGERWQARAADLHRRETAARESAAAARKAAEAEGMVVVVVNERTTLGRHLDLVEFVPYPGQDAAEFRELLRIVRPAAPASGQALAGAVG